MENNEGHLNSQVKVLHESKLLAYSNLVESKQEYIRIVNIKKKYSYPLDNWILSFIQFYDIMYGEVSKEPYKTKFKDVFKWVEMFEQGLYPEYDLLCKLTRQMMIFAHEVGIVKVEKVERGRSVEYVPKS